MKINTPFLEEHELEAVESEFQTEAVLDNERYAGYSPFNISNELEFTEEGEWESDPMAHQYFEMMNELHDNEFESAIDNLVMELNEHLISFEASSPFLNEAATVELATNYLNPIHKESHKIFDNMATELEALPLSQMTEMELETSLDGIYRSKSRNFTPAQEFFFKKLVNKAKSVIKKVAKVAGKVSPIRVILEKLKGVVGPLIKQVLNKLLNRLPVGVRDIAKDLSDKLFQKKGDESTDVEEGTDSYDDDSIMESDDIREESYLGNEGQYPTTYPSKNIQGEFNHYISRLVNSESEMQQNDIISEYQQSANTEYENHYQNVYEARELFINELGNLKEGDDPTPALENFLPVILKAAMTVVKTGIKIIGREKVVKFLADLMAKFISKYIGEEKAGKLSMVLADKGLKLLKLETPENETGNSRLVYEAIANTIEEVANKVSNLNEEVLKDPELLAHESYQAFEKAAAAYFPDNLIKYEARESDTGDGYWQSKGKYLKHSKIFETVLTLTQVKNIETFGGVKVANFLSDTLKIKTDNPIKVKVHLYQAKQGATISEIALHEKSVPGLGSASRAAYNQLHVLTKNAASVILGQPDLGKDVRPIRNRNRNLIFVGERFYFLQIEGVGIPSPVKPNDEPAVPDNPVVPPIVDVNPTGRSTQLMRYISGSIKGGLDIKDVIYFSEIDSQKIVEALKKQANGELYEHFKNLRPNFEKNFFGDKHKLGGAILQRVLQVARVLIEENLSKIVLEKIKHHTDDFIKAAEDPREGVSVIITYKIALKKGKKLKDSIHQTLDSVSINILAGYTQESSPNTNGKCPHCAGLGEKLSEMRYQGNNKLNNLEKANTFSISRAQFS